MDLYDVPYAKSITLNRAMDANTEEFIDHLKSAMPDYLPENERGYYSMILLYTKMSILKNDNNNYHNNNDNNIDTRERDKIKESVSMGICMSICTSIHIHSPCIHLS